MILRRGARAVVRLVAIGALAAGSVRAGPAARIEVGEDVQARLDEASEGAVLELAPGRHPGPLRLERRVTLRGPGEAVVVSQGSGSTVSLTGAGAALEGITIDGSGGRFDLLDAAVHVQADEVRVEGVTVRNALFGILVERCRRVLVRGNEVRGDPGKALGLRGDGIRLWEVRESRIESNRVDHSRDIVVWYAPGNEIRGNRVTGGRYGTHLMYSHDNVIEDNRYVDDVVGIFAMYSRNLALRRNLVARSSGAAGVGLGLKESSGIQAEGNWFVANATGIYLDTSPLDPADENAFRDNLFRFSDAAIVFHGVARGNSFVANSFRDNGIAVRVEGRGDALAARWAGNDYDDYAGFDLDRDGVGDLPYELRSLSSSLESRRPSLAFFRGTAAMALVELVGRALPLFRPTTLMVDPEPRMRPPQLAPTRTGG